MDHEPRCRTASGTPPVGETHSHLVVFQHQLANGRYLPTDVVLQYVSADPYAVGAHFNAGTPSEVVWLFDREHLAEGMFTPVGEGDIKVRPFPDEPVSVLIELSSPTGRAVFSVDIADLARFLYCTYEIFLPGDEFSWVDFEHELSRLDPGEDNPSSTTWRPAAEP
ncbi:SsgA family sporulation/cell division regulator [Amycolatopsis sp. NPDC051061]|uniref:SsgA family sporulation/cell division regulator n=1 Tax=Amycolatopsis sp. NPDC051061 TaxID=3155042 RepID=UPI0034271BBA